MKTMITETGVTFKELEKNIYSWVCQIGRQFTREFMERYDRMLMEGCDREKYRHKGLRQTTVKGTGGKVCKEEEQLVEEYKKGHIQGEKEVPVLFEKADGVYVRLQGKDRKKAGRGRRR